MVDLPIIINPGGQRQTVKIAEAIMIIDEKNGKAEYPHGYFHKPRNRPRRIKR